MEQNITNILIKKIEELTETIYDETIRLEEPPSISLGDYSTNISFKLAKLLKKSPMVIAEELTNLLISENIEGIKEIKAVNGYINFFIDYNLYSKSGIAKISSEKDKFGQGAPKNKKVIIEHTSANPNGPLHIGHSRNAIVGDSLKRIVEFAGYVVEAQYYVNDMGRQEAIVVYGLDKFELNEQQKPDHAIGEVYFKANQLLNENPEQEEEILKLMKKYEEASEKGEENELTNKFNYAVNYALSGFKETLNNLNIHHDKFVWESSYVKNGMVQKVIQTLKDTGKVEKDEVYRLDLSEFGIDKKLVLARLNGTSLYSTRDIAYHIDKMKNCDIGINILGADHKLTAEMVNASLKLLGYNTPEVVFYEFISLPEGSMSTRRGTFISIDELYEEAKNRAVKEIKKRNETTEEEEINNIAHKIAVGAVRYNIVRISPDKAMVFRWDDALDFEKVGAPVIQYAHARCCRILEKENTNENKPIDATELFEYDLNEHEKLLIKILLKFPKIVEKSADAKKPQIMATYALDVAQTFNRYYANCPIFKEENKNIVYSRLELVKCTKTIIENALNLLGIECPGKM
ncbi:arginine--tRNA ligase [Methanococcus aeolicus]|uniref:Arginine--tRNA ligase n=1 Tax=Methanococcus aeolicus (strain ATCC BAA-1280 / DSM 17508 / OCM 812 / Nankai-3) TaxID=419665 RepID=SYR_META3|nr:arginine--tRNA ligase [Methanococcus aeolicus]A6UW07.1 RecName: Full=Arginine--tRNA ligase; AltName: Full=Arginyl-tRNA synthetase; Short=ArgRS [Methanococcus aeolicus Nankai-3]ABR56679.1 arginyl-tRNA synthetase [Methanococcus aeolicus Nankai-3]UXM84681.1 arginine--tRNA ligase [Methanococcus aeolicus]